MCRRHGRRSSACDRPGNQVMHGEKIKELWVNARDLQKSDGQSDASYREQLVTRGKQKLSEYFKAESAGFEILSNADMEFAIGDKCVYVNRDMSVEAEGRITEIYEIWEKEYKKNIVLGEQTLKFTQKIRCDIS